MTAPSFRAGFLLFPNLTQLDLTGPAEVLARVPGGSVTLIWKTLEPVRSDSGLSLLPTDTFQTALDAGLDLICVPGGPGVGPLMEDPEVHTFLRAIAEKVTYVTSVCTGSLVLGSAGLLKGKRAACHWLSRELLTSFGAIPVSERVVRDGNVFTGGGVTAGIDFGLTVAAEVAGTQAAQGVQLMIEYAPAPPYDSGSPDTAPATVLNGLLEASKDRQAERAAIAARAGAKL